MPAFLAFFRRVPVPWLLLPPLVVLWLAPRFLDAPAPPNAAVESAIEAVRAGPSPGTGRLEVWGLPSPGSDPGGLLSRPAILAARARLTTAVRAGNDALSLRAADIARRLEPTEDDLVGLRLSGWLIPFYGPHAEQLRRLERDAAGRPWEALRALTVALEARLEEPPEGVDLEISGQRRDLTRLYREIDDALLSAETAATTSVETFRADVRAAAGEAAGPFHRRGRGLFLEILLASLIGATLREAIRARGALPGMIVRVSVAPVLALSALLSLEGTALLPVDPLRGVSLVFLPMAFGLGYATGGILQVVSRLERLFREERGEGNADATRVTAAEAPVTPEADASRTAAHPPTPSPAGPAAPAAASNGPDAPAGTESDPAPGAPTESARDSLRPLRERVRELAREVMEATGEPLRTERELPEEPGPVAAPPPPAPPAPAERKASPRDPERLPFARRRPR